MVDRKVVAISALIFLLIISAISATSTSLALTFNKNEKITQQNLCTNKAFCRNRYSQAPRNLSLEEQPLASSWLTSTSPALTPSLGSITTSGVAISDISSIDPSPPGSVIATIPVGSAPFGVAFDSANGNLYVVNQDSGTVSVISGQTNTVVGSPIPVGNSPFCIAYDSANDDLYVGNGDGHVSVISGQTNTVIRTLQLVSGANSIAFDSANGDLYVSNPASHIISIISGNTNTLVDTINTLGPGGNGIMIESVAFDSENGNIYAAGWPYGVGGAILLISGQTNTVIATVPVPLSESPTDTIVFDSANDNLYATNSGSDTVYVISGKTNTVIGNPITVGSGPEGISFDSANGNLYVVVFTGDKVSVISGQTNTVIGTPIPVGFEARYIAFDSANDNLYVTNSGDNTVSVIAPAHSTTLTLKPISNMPSGGTVTVTGNLTDNETSNTGIGGKTITFTGNGAANISSVTTNPDGTFTATGTAPNAVATGWTVQAHFAGDTSFEASNSTVETYNTFATTLPDTTITSVIDGNGAAVKGPPEIY